MSRSNCQGHRGQQTKKCGIFSGAVLGGSILYAGGEISACCLVSSLLEFWASVCTTRTCILSWHIEFWIMLSCIKQNQPINFSFSLTFMCYYTSYINRNITHCSLAHQTCLHSQWYCHSTNLPRYTSLCQRTETGRRGKLHIHIWNIQHVWFSPRNSFRLQKCGTEQWKNNQTIEVLNSWWPDW